MAHKINSVALFFFFATVIVSATDDTSDGRDGWRIATTVALKNADLGMHVDKFLEQRIQTADFSSLSQEDLKAMGFTIGDIHRFRRNFPMDVLSDKGKGNSAALGQLMQLAQGDRLDRITSLLERLNVGESNPLDPQQLVEQKFGDLDGIYGGLLGRTMNFAKSKFSSPGELTLRKAIMVHLFNLGRLKLPTIQETVFQDVLTTDAIADWTKDPKVEAVMPLLEKHSLETVRFLDQIDGVIDGRIGPIPIGYAGVPEENAEKSIQQNNGNPPVRNERGGGCCSG